MVVMMLTMTVAVLCNRRCSLVSASLNFAIAKFRIPLFQPRFSLDAMTPVAQRFWVCTVRIVPGRRPGCTSRSRIGSTANCKGRDQAPGLLATTGRALRLSNCIRGAQKQV